MKKLPILVAFLLTLALSACSEKVAFKVVNPPANYRVTQEFVEGQSAFVPLTIRYDGTEPQKVALIKVNGIGPLPCTLISGIEVNCGSIPLTKLGGQNLHIEVSKANGEVIAQEVTFRWEPYQGLEKFAYNFSGFTGDKSAPLGFLYLGFLAFLVVGCLALFITMKSGYIHRQGDGVSVTFKDADGRSLDYSETRGSFTGRGTDDQPRPRLEPAFFEAATRLLISDSNQQNQILLSQGDMEEVSYEPSK